MVVTASNRLKILFIILLESSPEGSGKRGSNPRPLAWEANALPTELLPPV